MSFSSPKVLLSKKRNDSRPIERLFVRNLFKRFARQWVRVAFEKSEK
jgi:hypothetical protein